MKPIHKFNGGLGATLCHKCRVIINVGFSEELYCKNCINIKKMAQQKLYTEEQVREGIKSALDGFGIGETEDTIDIVMSKLVPIELPSDEEINEKVKDFMFEKNKEVFYNGAKWMREQILNK